MYLRLLDDIVEGLEPFILFEVPFANHNMHCVGYEWYCTDRKCDCRMAHVMVHDANTGDRVAHILYGWCDYKYYRQQKFLKSDINEFIHGGLSPDELLTAPKEAVLKGFQEWLCTDRMKKDRLFMQRYKKFKDGMLNPRKEAVEEVEKTLELLLDNLDMDEILDVLNSEEFDKTLLKKLH